MRRLLVPAATVVAVAVALRIAFAEAWYLNYDARYALDWARDLLHGVQPDFQAPFAPTPHPLSLLWSLPGALLGDWVVRWLVLLAFGAVVVLVFRLGRELLSPGVGAAAVVVVATRAVLLRDAALGYQDVPFAALVLGAVLLEARRRRRGAPVLVLLALAGLLRPEAWVLAGLYWLLVRDWRLLPLVVAAPLLWMLMDLAITGDALHSLHGTADLAEQVGRRRDVADAPRWTVQYLAYTLRAPVGLGILAGLAFAVRHRRRVGRGAVLLLATAAAMLVTFALSPVFGLPLIARYVRTPSVLLALLFGLAVAGWTLLEPSRERRAWQAVAAVVAAVFLAFLPQDARRVEHQRRVFHRTGKVYEDLRKAGRSPVVRRCAPIATADHRLVAHLRWWLDDDVTTAEAGGPARTLLVPRDNVRNRLFYGDAFPRVAPPPGPVRYRNRSFRLQGGC